MNQRIPLALGEGGRERGGGGMATLMELVLHVLTHAHAHAHTHTPCRKVVSDAFPRISCLVLWLWAATKGILLMSLGSGMNKGLSIHSFSLLSSSLQRHNVFRCSVCDDFSAQRHTRERSRWHRRDH